MKVYVVLWETNPDSYTILGVFQTEQDAKIAVKHKIEQYRGRYDTYDFETHEEYIQ